MGLLFIIRILFFNSFLELILLVLILFREILLVFEEDGKMKLGDRLVLLLGFNDFKKLVKIDLILLIKFCKCKVVNFIFFIFLVSLSLLVYFFVLSKLL